MAGNANFSTEENDECLPNFAMFGENELLEISDNLDDDDIPLFIEENQNVRTTKMTKTNLNVLKRWSLAEKCHKILCHAFTFLLISD